MAPNLQLLLLLGTISVVRTKYVYVEDQKTWSEALSVCKRDYTDLAPVNDEHDIDLLREEAGSTSAFISFGLMRNMTDTSKWMWSGGGEVTRFFWDENQPDPAAGEAVEPNAPSGEKYGIMKNYLWHDADTVSLNFFCFSVHAVREKKNWEDALQYCRKNHRDLSTISSETELMLIQKELSKGASTEHVWIGLHFLAGDWLWLDGQSGGYNVWGDRGKPACPVEMPCGALTVSQKGVKQWNARDCEEMLHFVCY